MNPALPPAGWACVLDIPNHQIGQPDYGGDGRRRAFAPRTSTIHLNRPPLISPAPAKQ
jgi:hypothetical protein